MKPARRRVLTADGIRDIQDACRRWKIETEVAEQLVKALPGMLDTAKRQAESALRWRRSDYRRHVRREAKRLRLLASETLEGLQALGPTAGIRHAELDATVQALTRMRSMLERVPEAVDKIERNKMLAAKGAPPDFAGKSLVLLLASWFRKRAIPISTARGGILALAASAVHPDRPESIRRPTLSWAVKTSAELWEDDQEFQRQLEAKQRASLYEDPYATAWNSEYGAGGSQGSSVGQHRTLGELLLLARESDRR